VLRKGEQDKYGLQIRSIFISKRPPRALRVDHSLKDGSHTMLDEVDLRVQNVVLGMVHALVDSPEDVVIHSSLNQGVRTFGIVCRQEDAGKIIGKQGRTARSIRTILSAISMQNQRRYALDIQDNNANLSPKK
jgi:uncharacterized protein